MSELKDLIDSVSGVLDAEQSRAFIKRLEFASNASYQEVTESVIENIDSSKMFDAWMSDSRVHNTASELNVALKFAVNEYIEEKKGEYND